MYEQDAPATFALNGMISVKPDGREALVTVDDFDPQATPQLAARLGAAKVKIEDLSLEEAFVELAGTEQAK